MNKDLTDITVVFDRSGSMASCKSDAEGGLNSFIKKQKQEPGRALFTLVQFDNVYEFVHKAVPLEMVEPNFVLMPRGGTALLDAVGRAMTETGERLKAMPPHERPGLVIFVIVTDGEENASREFSLATVRSMIEHQQAKYDWQFTYLGAHQRAFAEASSMGIPVMSAGMYRGRKSEAAMGAVHSNVSRMRASASAGIAPTNTYTEQERASMTDEEEDK